MLVAAGHIILALVILHARDDMPNGAENPPAIMIELAPLAVAPPAEEMTDVPPAPTKTEEAQPEETTPPTPPTPDVVPPVVPPPELPQMAQPDVPPPPPPVMEPPPQAVTVPEAPLAPKPEVVLAPPPKPAAPPKPAPKVEKKVVKPEHKPPAERTAAPRHVDAAPSRNAAAPSQAAGTPSMSSSAWQSLVSARLNSVKQCPGGASGSHGVATVSFTITGGGGVGGAHLAGSSGTSALDQEAVGMVHRASPYPPPPGGRPVSLSVPIRFGC